MSTMRHQIRYQMACPAPDVERMGLIGLGDDISSHDDEYDCLIGPLLTRLAAQATAHDLTAYLRQEIRDHFGLRPGVRDVATFADRVVTWWRSEPTTPDISEGAQGR